MDSFEPCFTSTYHPLKAGSIDGTDGYPHDKAIARAMGAVYKPNKYVKGDAECTIFVGRLSTNTSEEVLEKSFSQFGRIQNVRIVRDIVTGCSKCYGFVEFREPYEARDACRNGHKMIIDDHEVLVDSEKERTMKGWIPRRLGGGLGGKRESGQLRFGGKDRQFRRPLVHELKGKKDSNSQTQRHSTHSSDSRRHYSSSRKHKERSESRI